MSAGTNPVGTFAVSNFTVDTATVWKTKQDANSMAAQRVVDAFAPHPASPAAMSVIVDAGFVTQIGPDGTQHVTEAATQTVTIAAAPASPNNRIDLVVVDAGTGVASVVAGTPAGSPTAPALPAGKKQICQVSVPNGTSSIGGANITDLRAVWGHNRPGIPFAVASGSSDAITAAFTPATPTLGAAYDGWMWRVRAIAANTGTTPTFAADGQTALTIKRLGGGALVAGDISGAGHEMLLSYNYNGGAPFIELLNPARPDLMSLTTKGQSFTGGVRASGYSLGTGSGTVTPDPGNGPLQYIYNNGAFTIDAPAYDGAFDLMVINQASAGNISLSGFTVSSSTGYGDTFVTTNGAYFIFSIRRIAGVSTILIKQING